MCIDRLFKKAGGEWTDYTDLTLSVSPRLSHSGSPSVSPRLSHPVCLTPGLCLSHPRSPSDSPRLAQPVCLTPSPSPGKGLRSMVQRKEYQSIKQGRRQKDDLIPSSLFFYMNLSTLHSGNLLVCFQSCAAHTADIFSLINM